MSTSPWDDMTKRWKDVTDAQAEATKHWFDTQAQLASTLAGAGAGIDPTSDAAAMAEVWRSSMALGGMLTRGLPGTEAGGIANEMLTRMLNPMSSALAGGNQVGDIVRRMTEGPRFADVGSLERRMAEVMDLYLKVQTATRRYEGVVATAWTEANQSFAEDIAERARAGNGLRPGKEVLGIWMEIANSTLTRTHRSPEFLTAQRDLLRASMDFLLAERGLFEQLVEPVGLPTRSEIDEVHRSVQQLKRRVRTLEDQQQLPRSGGKAPALKRTAGETTAGRTTTSRKTAARAAAARTATEGGTP